MMLITRLLPMFLMRMPSQDLLRHVLQQRLDALLLAGEEFKAGTREHSTWQAKVRRLRLSIARTKGSHTTAQWDALVAETGGICVRCGYQHDLNVEKPCKGYILPIAAGGSNAISNIMPLCLSCARSKNAEAINWLAAWRKQNAVTTP